MSEQGKDALVKRVRAICEEARSKADVFDQAAQYCPPPYSVSLANVSAAFQFFCFEIESVISELEAVFDNSGNDLTQDVERPGE